MPMQPKHLDYRMSQFLLIGHSQGDVGKALQANEKDAKDDGKKTAEEEMEKLEAEDEHRVAGLKGESSSLGLGTWEFAKLPIAGDDSVFADLGVSKKDYPKVKTTW